MILLIYVWYALSLGTGRDAYVIIDMCVFLLNETREVKQNMLLLTYGLPRRPNPRMTPIIS